MLEHYTLSFFLYISILTLIDIFVTFLILSFSFVPQGDKSILTHEVLMYMVFQIKGIFEQSVGGIPL